MRNNASRVLPFPAEDRKFIRPPRVLRIVDRVIEHDVQLDQNYHVKYWTQVLECGHHVEAFAPEDASKERRQCPECSHALRLALRAPVATMPSQRKRASGRTRVA